MTVGSAATITALPWFLNFKFFGDGVGLVSGRSPIWQMGVLWGGHVVVTVIAIIMVFRKGTTLLWPDGQKGPRLGPLLLGSDLLVAGMGVTALLLLIIPEVVYVKDIYTSHQRANTMFKLTYQAFILMSLVFGWVVGKVSGFVPKTRLQAAERSEPSFANAADRRRFGSAFRLQGSDPFKKLLLILMVVLWGGFMVFPVQAFSSYYGEFKKYKGMNGLEWLRKDTDKWGMIDHLENNRDGNNMIEAVGDSYTELNSVSAFSGTPTVIGWRVHERVIW